jgi:ParB family transcriptional regulator, chromosome partitioning protein
VTLDLSGLDSIDLDVAPVQEAASGAPLEVDYSEVYEDTNNPRTEFNETEIAELADDIARHGMLQPIVVWPKDSLGYRIRYGARRRRAAEVAATTTGIRRVPIVVNAREDLDDYAQVAENLKRSALTPMDMAKFIKRKVDAGESKGEIAKGLGFKSQARISEYLSLLSMPAPIADAYLSGRCTEAGLIYELTGLHRKMEKAVKSLLEGDEEVTRKTIRAMAESAKPKAFPPAEMPTKGTSPSAKVSSRREPNVASLERRLTEFFGSRIIVLHNASTGRGNVTFRYTSLDELDGLIERWRVPGE